MSFIYFSLCSVIGLTVLFSTAGCSSATVREAVVQQVPALDMAQRIYQADQIDCAFNDKVCRLPNWSSCFKFQKDSSFAPKGQAIECPVVKSDSGKDQD